MTDDMERDISRRGIFSGPWVDPGSPEAIQPQVAEYSGTTSTEPMLPGVDITPVVNPYIVFPPVGGV